MRSHGEIWYVWARLKTAGLDASLRVSAHYATGFDELVDFFRRLAANWRGWQGAQAHESLEHELRLTALHDGHVRLTVYLRQSSLLDGWSAAAVSRSILARRWPRQPMTWRRYCRHWSSSERVKKARLASKP
ncbi:MAG: DUF6228 family protein [Streptosporangiaceae bacterium]